jgi:hypothetical protein
MTVKRRDLEKKQHHMWGALAILNRIGTSGSSDLSTCVGRKL